MGTATTLPTPLGGRLPITQRTTAHHEDPTGLLRVTAAEAVAAHFGQTLAAMQAPTRRALVEADLDQARAATVYALACLGYGARSTGAILHRHHSTIATRLARLEDQLDQGILPPWFYFVSNLVEAFEDGLPLPTSASLADLPAPPRPRQALPRRDLATYLSATVPGIPPCVVDYITCTMGNGPGHRHNCGCFRGYAVLRANPNAGVVLRLALEVAGQGALAALLTARGLAA